MEKNPDPGSEIRNPQWIPRSYLQELGLKIRITFKFFIEGPGPVTLFTMDPGWKNSIPGSGMNIPDPLHWLFETRDDFLDLVRYPYLLAINYTRPSASYPPKLCS